MKPKRVWNMEENQYVAVTDSTILFIDEDGKAVRADGDYRNFSDSDYNQDGEYKNY